MKTAQTIIIGSQVDLIHKIMEKIPTSMLFVMDLVPMLGPIAILKPLKTEG